MQHVSTGHNELQSNLSGTNACVRQTDRHAEEETNQSSEYLTGEAKAAKE
jgi:hypothetical protein